MTERLSNERLAELEDALAAESLGLVCTPNDVSALLDEVLERRAAEPSRTLPCGYTMRLWKCPKCGRTFDDADELDDGSLMEDCEVAPQCGPCNETMVPA